MQRGTAILVGVTTVIAAVSGLAVTYHYFNEGGIGDKDILGPREPTVSILSHTPMSSTQLREFLATHQGNNWNLYSGQPATQIDVLPMRRTALAGVYGRTQANLRTWLSEIRRATNGTAYADCDPRCVLYLWALETGWFKYAWNWNLGNVKARPFATPASLRAGYCWSDTTHSINGTFALLDGVDSIDLYYSFPNVEAYIERETSLFAEARFRGAVIANYQRGGSEGLIAAREAQHIGGYSGSPGNFIQRRTWLSEAAGYWRACERIAGTDWTR